jgi:hypothetical protein
MYQMGQQYGQMGSQQYGQMGGQQGMTYGPQYGQMGGMQYGQVGTQQAPMTTMYPQSPQQFGTMQQMQGPYEEEEFEEEFEEEPEEEYYQEGMGYQTMPTLQQLGSSLQTVPQPPSLQGMQQMGPPSPPPVPSTTFGTQQMTRPYTSQPLPSMRGTQQMGIPSPPSIPPPPPSFGTQQGGTRPYMSQPLPPMQGTQQMGLPPSPPPSFPGQQNGMYQEGYDGYDYDGGKSKKDKKRYVQIDGDYNPVGPIYTSNSPYEAARKAASKGYQTIRLLNPDKRRVYEYDGYNEPNTKPNAFTQEKGIKHQSKVISRGYRDI